MLPSFYRISRMFRTNLNAIQRRKKLSMRMTVYTHRITRMLRFGSEGQTSTNSELKKYGIQLYDSVMSTMNLIEVSICFFKKIHDIKLVKGFELSWHGHTRLSVYSIKPTKSKCFIHNGF